MTWLSVTLFVGLASGLPVAAHPGHSLHDQETSVQNQGERTWLDVKQNVSYTGTFVSANDGLIQIRKADDSLIRLHQYQVSPADQAWVRRRIARIQATNEGLGFWFRPRPLPANDDKTAEEQTMKDRSTARALPLLLAQLGQTDTSPATDSIPEIANAFAAFVKTKAIVTRWDRDFFYVESNGIPDHQMMVGITAWQQQVPLPQSYTRRNSWQIPLHPVPAKKPLSAKTHFLRGAIALAVNGVPIFNPLNNRGEDAFLFGELDEFGGHCGRADDYHYHLAPVHLEKTIGAGLPIAYALDGYPIYGYSEPDGTKVQELDVLNGHVDEHGHYHYHASKTYPYLNGGFHGTVTERGGQVDPQPRSEPLRPAGRPLRDAKITDFAETEPGQFRLTFETQGKIGSVSYSTKDPQAITFVFTDPNGKRTTETYSLKARGPQDRNRRPPPRPGERPPR